MKRKLLLPFFLVLIFTMSCHDENEIRPGQKTNPDKVEVTSLAREPQLESVLKVAGFLSGSRSGQARLNEQGDELDVAEVLKVTQEDSTHHTFTFKIANNTRGSFSNLVVEELPNGNYLAFILRFEFEGQFSGLDRYTGKITRFDLGGNTIRELNFKNGEVLTDAGNMHAKASQTSDCLTGVTTEEVCLEWITWHNALGEQTSCLRKALVVTMEYGDCSSYEPTTPSDPPSDPYGGGTTITGPGSPSPGSTPEDDIDAGNPVAPIPGYKPKKPIVIVPDEWPGSEDGLPYEWWLNDAWLDENFSLSPDDEDYRLNAAERQLVKQYPADAYMISKNAPKAEAETIRRFGHNGLNDQSDAFRHAFFNAMNERDCGDDQNLNSIAKKFSDAHESETPTPLALEKEMDLYNNSWGHVIGDVMFPILTTDSSLSDKVMEKVNDGTLKYLHPTLAPNQDPNWNTTHGINSSTRLIPTNTP